MASILDVIGDHVLRWKKADKFVDVFQCVYWIIPANKARNHWAISVVYEPPSKMSETDKTVIMYLDSKKGGMRRHLPSHFIRIKNIIDGVQKWAMTPQKEPAFDLYKCHSETSPASPCHFLSKHLLCRLGTLPSSRRHVPAKILSGPIATRLTIWSKPL